MIIITGTNFKRDEGYIPQYFTWMYSASIFNLFLLYILKIDKNDSF